MTESIGQILNKRKTAGQKALVAYVTSLSNEETVSVGKVPDMMKKMMEKK